MTRTKAVAGGIATNVTIVVLWLLTLVPGWTDIPEVPKASIIALVSGGIGYGVVFWSPPNKPTVEMQSTGRFDE